MKYTTQDTQEVLDIILDNNRHKGHYYDAEGNVMLVVSIKDNIITIMDGDIDVIRRVISIIMHNAYVHVELSHYMQRKPYTCMMCVYRKNKNTKTYSREEN